MIELEARSERFERDATECEMIALVPTDGQGSERVCGSHCIVANWLTPRPRPTSDWHQAELSRRSTCAAEDRLLCVRVREVANRCCYETALRADENEVLAERKKPGNLHRRKAAHYHVEIDESQM